MRIFFTLLICCFLIGCHDHYENCEFRPSQMVRAKLNGQIGQVIGMFPADENPFQTPKWCYATVRFVGHEIQTNTHILSSDDPVEVKVLSTLKYMRPYELEHLETNDGYETR